MNKHNIILNITLSGFFLSLGLLLPFLTGQVPEIGNMLCPMHIPVLICGFICGYKYGLVVGFTTPLLRSFIFQMPPFYPAALAMSFELATYGLIAGLLFNLFNKYNKKGIIYNYLILIISMLSGRIIWGIVRYLLATIDGSYNFTIELFISGAFISAWPGIILQLIIIPVIISSLSKLNIIKNNYNIQN